VAAEHLESYGYTVRSNIGGHGLIGILENGLGKTILLRADTDALPVLEKTGLPYASKRQEIDLADQVLKPVMHACGHDMHVSLCLSAKTKWNQISQPPQIVCMLAAANTLSQMTRFWHGTLIILFQPNEERGKGARDMVSDELYDPRRHACPVPDIILGQHVMPFPAGHIGTRRGVVAAAADGLKITVYGRGGHASQPHRCVDPVVLASHIVVRLQSIVSREVPPTESAVVTVGAVQAGQTENIIADYAEMRVTVRNSDAETRTRVLLAIKRVVAAECQASDSPRKPEFENTLQVPLTRNDEYVAAALEAPFRAYFGERYSDTAAGLGGSEDFAILADAVDKPYCYWTFGGSDPMKWKEADDKGRVQEDIPVNHSPFFAPPIQPTLITGADAMVIGALTFLGK
jgi:amidohydrolase